MPPKAIAGRRDFAALMRDMKELAELAESDE